jgi:hypothetical protein
VVPLSLPDVVVSERLSLRLVSREDAEGMLAGRRRVSWHPDYPRKDDQDAAAMVKADDPQACWGPRHIVRSGDGRNDLEMLRWAGRGVAMGQAVPEVHEAADATTLTVDEDGAAAELSLWFPAT